MVFQLALAYPDLWDNQLVDASMNVNVMSIVGHRNNVKTSNVSRRVVNVERELNVFESQIIEQFVNVPKIILDLHTPNVELNVMAMLIALEVNQLAFMEFVRILVMVLVVLELIVI